MKRAGSLDVLLEALRELSEEYANEANITRSDDIDYVRLTAMIRLCDDIVARVEKNVKEYSK